MEQKASIATALVAGRLSNLCQIRDGKPEQYLVVRVGVLLARARSFVPRVMRIAEVIDRSLRELCYLRPQGRRDQVRQRANAMTRAHRLPWGELVSGRATECTQ